MWLWIGYSVPGDCCFKVLDYLETVEYVSGQVREFIMRLSYASIVLLNDPKLWKDVVKKDCMLACKAKGLTFDCVDASVSGSKEILVRLQKILRKRLIE